MKKNQYVLFKKITAITPLLLLLTPVASGVSAFADGVCSSQCNQPPAKPFSWNEAFADFAKGVAPTLSQLSGSWSTAGVVNLPGYPDNSIHHGDFYNPSSTVKNPDGSVFDALQFFQQNAFDGSSHLLADLLNDGATGVTGPVVVNFNSTDACFTQAFPQGYYETFACRLLPADSNKLICMVAPFFPSSINWEPSLPPYNNVAIEFLAYERSQ